LILHLPLPLSIAVGALRPTGQVPEWYDGRFETPHFLLLGPSLNPAPAPNYRLNAFSRIADMLVSPNADDAPTRSAETLIGICVPGSIGFDFFTPKLRVVFGPGSVFRAAMPEAAINEDGDFGARKNDVGDAARLGQ
jgi:hypothetical protein